MLEWHCLSSFFFHYLLSNSAFISMLMIATTDGAARIRTTLCHSVIRTHISRVAIDLDKVMEQGTLVWELSCPFACSMTSLGTICLFCLVPSDVTRHHLLSCALHFKFTIPDWRTLLHDFASTTQLLHLLHTIVSWWRKSI